METTESVKADEGSPEPCSASATDENQAVEVVFNIQYGKAVQEAKRPLHSTVGELKGELEKVLGIPPHMQKLMLKGFPLKIDDQTLQQAGIKDKCKVLLIGTAPSQVATASASAPKDLQWDAPVEKDEPISKQAQHAKILAKGKPEDALPGIANKQTPLLDSQTYIPGLLNSQGNKVRLTFKPELEQLWLGSATSTQKVPYATVAKIEAWPIEGQEEYSILAMQVGSSASSRYWLYYVPSQYVAAIKMRILGIMSLI